MFEQVKSFKLIAMTKNFWINLPVKDIERSKQFYSQLGFTIKPVPGNRKDSASLVLGEKEIQFILFEEPAFRTFIDSEITDAQKSSEVLFSIDAENPDEVISLAKKVEKAGGRLFAEPGEKDGWYGCGFADPDGHRWNILHMDNSSMPKQKIELQVP
jgi:predicted lactoylglutathione lyase